MDAMTKCCLTALGALAFCAGAGAADAPAIDPSWLPKVEAGLEVLLKKYDEIAPRLETASETRGDKVPGPASKVPVRAQTRHERFVRLGDNYLFERVRILDGAPLPQITLECDNADYHFRLGRQREGAAYVVKDYGTGKQKIPMADQGFTMHHEVFRLLRIALGAIRKDGKHTLRSLRRDGDRGLVWLAFSYTVDKQPIEDHLGLDPDHSWRLVERKVESTNMAVTERYTHGTTVGGVEFPTGFEDLCVAKVPEGAPNMKNVTKVTSIMLTDKTAADFRLSAFGMPEPMGAPPPPARPTRWYLWILAAAGVCAALAFMFSYLRRRLQARRAAISGGAA